MHQLIGVVRETGNDVAVAVRGGNRGLLFVQLLNGADPVAVNGGALVIHRFGAFVHSLGQLRDHGLVFAV